jgi:hypothetical protein
MSSLHKFSWMILNGGRCSEIGRGEGKSRVLRFGFGLRAGGTKGRGTSGGSISE